MKKIKMVLLSFLIFVSAVILPNEVKGEVNTLSTDTTPPELVSIEVNQNMFNVDDTLEIKVKASDDDSGVEGIYVSYNPIENGATIQKNISLSYNANQDLWVGKYKFEELDGEGIWEISNVLLLDKMSNERLYRRGELENANQYDITLTNATGGDVVGPTVEHVEIGANVLESGETTSLTINASDDKSGIRSVSVLYLSSPVFSLEHSKSLMAIYDENSGKWKAEMKFNEYDKSGMWKIFSIYLYDNAGNYTRLTREEIPNPSNFDVNYKNKNIDVNPPTLENITLNKNMVDVGERVVFEAKVRDDLSGTSHIILDYVISINGVMKYRNFYLRYDADRGVCYTSELFNEKIHEGYWILRKITLFDNAMNEAVITRKELDNPKNMDIIFGIPDSGDVTEPNKPVVNEVTDKSRNITGTAEADSIVTVEVDNKIIGESIATISGEFTIQIQPQFAETVLNVTATDKTGNISGISQVIVRETGNETPPKIFSINEMHDFGKFSIHFTKGVNPFDIKKELLLSAEDPKDTVFYDVYETDFINGRADIEITNASIGKQYYIAFSDKFIVPEGLDTTVEWTLNQEKSYIYDTVFPQKPFINGDFKVAIDLPFSVTDNSRFEVKAYKSGTDQPVDGQFLLKKIEKSYDSDYIFTLSYDRSEMIDIEFEYNSISLGNFSNLMIGHENDEINNHPTWWKYLGIYSAGRPKSPLDPKTSATIRWTEAYDLEGITHYRIKVNGEVVDTVPSNVHTYNVTNLLSGTKYDLSVEAGNARELWTTTNNVFEYKTPGEDKEVTGVGPWGNILGGFYLELEGASVKDIKQGIKVYYLDNGIKNYVNYSTDHYLILDSAKLKTEYYVEVSDPLYLKEGSNTVLVWDTALDRSKVIQNTEPKILKTNEEFTFRVVLNDEAGFGYRNVKKDNFKLTPLKAGTNELAEGNLVIKNVKSEAILNEDRATRAKNASTYYITASYSKSGAIDIQVSVDGVILPEKLNNITINPGGGLPEIPPVNPPITPPSGGGMSSGGSGSTSNTLVTAPPSFKETKEGIEIKGDLSKVDWDKLYSIMKKQNTNEIKLDLIEKTNIPLKPLLVGKSNVQDGYLQFHTNSGTARINLAKLDEKWIKENFGEDGSNFKLLVEVQSNSQTNADKGIVASSLPVKSYIQSGDKKLEVDWISSQVILPDSYKGEVILVKKNEITNEWMYVPHKIIEQGKQRIVEAKIQTDELLYVIDQNITFEDLNEHWAEKDISWLASRYIVKGNEGIYKPQDEVSRAEFTSLLIRILGIEADDQKSATQFKDVDQSAWYSNDVNKALQLGLITGVDQTRFAPNESVTREQMAVMISKVMKYLGKEQTASGLQLEKEFNDMDQISDWANDAVRLMVDSQLMLGQGEQEFAPKDNATRAESAVLIKKLMLLLE